MEVFLRNGICHRLVNVGPERKGSANKIFLVCIY